MDSVPGTGFDGKQKYYSDYRLDYPNRVIEHIVDRFGLTEDSTVLDLGCGTGRIALQIAQHVSEVVAADPDTGMLEQGRQAADSQGIENIEWKQATGSEIHHLDRKFDVVTIGRAFHRMDTEQGLGNIKEVLKGGGGLSVLTSTEWFKRGTEPWQDTVHEVVQQRFDDVPDRTGPVSYDTTRTETLKSYGFQNVKKKEFVETKRFSVEEAAGYVLSLSFAPASGEDERRSLVEELKEELWSTNRLSQEIEFSVVSGAAPD
jgi:ubiquinone/menaquinone biosynthesis C-methylase UbiE